MRSLPVPTAASGPAAVAGVPAKRFVSDATRDMGARLVESVRRASGSPPAPLVGFWPAAGSTNDLARAAARDWDGLPAAGSVFVAGRQTAGRGRHGRRWFSPLGGLYLSVLAGRAGRVSRWAPEGFALLPLAAGVALATAVRQASGARAVIRWPNDVDVGGRKIGGVLAETGFRRRGPDLAVVGFGINCCPLELPERRREPPVRPPGWIPGTVDRAGLAAALVAAFHRSWALAQRSPADLAAQWESLSPSASGRVCRVRLTDGSEIAGRTDGLGQAGGLRVALDGGGRRVVFASEAIRIGHGRRERPGGRPSGSAGTGPFAG